MKNIDDDKVLVRYKMAGIPNHLIAAKMGISVNEVERRWKDLEAIAKEMDSGYVALVAQYTVLCQQYQLLGESLKIISSAISNRMTIADVDAIIASCKPEEISLKLMSSSIILRPFIQVNPEESLKESTQRIHQGN
jgi:CTP synthase (UTP-ammonia lyase)